MNAFSNDSESGTDDDKLSHDNFELMRAENERLQDQLRIKQQQNLEQLLTISELERINILLQKQTLIYRFQFKIWTIRLSA